MTTNNTIKLKNVHIAETDFFRMTHAVVQEIIPSLPFDVAFPLRKMIGEPFWKQLVGYEVVLAGICMSFLVATKQVAMEEAGKDSHNHKLYRRR